MAPLRGAGMGRRPAATGVFAPAGGLSSGMHPPYSFRSCPKRKRAVHGPKEKGARRAPEQWPSARRGSAYRCLLRFCLTFGHAKPFCDFPNCRPVGELPTSSGWLSHGAASLFATAHAPAKNPAARSAAERAEREADQMRPCTPLTFAPAPRESAFKPVPHPAAPVGRSSQTRRHHLSSTPVQQLCTDVQSCDQKRFFSYTGRGAFSFWR